jgi:hypothetical protein
MEIDDMTAYEGLSDRNLGYLEEDGMEYSLDHSLFMFIDIHV